jgi:hypothetical protein
MVQLNLFIKQEMKKVYFILGDQKVILKRHPWHPGVNFTPRGELGPQG